MSSSGNRSPGGSGSGSAPTNTTNTPAASAGLGSSSNRPSSSDLKPLGGGGGGGSGSTSQNEALKRMTKLVNNLLSKSECSPFREPVDWRGLELYDYPTIIKKMMDLGTIKRKLERHQYATAHECATDIRLVWSNCMTYNADGSDFWLLAKTCSRRFEDRYRKIKGEFDVGEPGGGGSSSGAAVGGGGSDVSHSRRGSGTGASGGGATNDRTTGSSSKSNKSHHNSATTSTPAASATTPSTTTTTAAPNGVPPPSLDTRAKFGANLFLLSAVELAHVIFKLESECPQALEQPDPIPPRQYSGDNVKQEDDATKKRPYNYNHYSSRSMIGIMDYQKLEINVDEIDSALFHELNKYVNDKVGTKTSSVGDMDSSGGVDDSMMSNTNTSSSSSRHHKKRKK